MALAQRLSFGSKLEAVMTACGKPLNLYFQPGPDATMLYPCIVYERDDVSKMPADNLPYALAQCYQVTYIDQDPDSDVIDALIALRWSKFDRHFATSGLNHDVFEIYH